jgi:hypothetical protein
MVGAIRRVSNVSWTNLSLASTVSRSIRSKQGLEEHEPGLCISIIWFNFSEWHHHYRVPLTRAEHFVKKPFLVHAKPTYSFIEL